MSRTFLKTDNMKILVVDSDISRYDFIDMPKSSNLEESKSLRRECGKVCRGEYGHIIVHSIYTFSRRFDYLFVLMRIVSV